MDKARKNRGKVTIAVERKKKRENCTAQRDIRRKKNGRMKDTETER